MKIANKKIRVFWGIALDAVVCEQLIVTSNSIKQQLEHHPIRWLHPENLHLTVRFIGETTVDVIEQCLKEVQLRLEKQKIFEIKLNEIQLFPMVRPHVIACMVSLNEALAQVFHLLEEACLACGLVPESRSYVPHITLARIKAHEQILIAGLPKPIAMQQVVSEIILYKSEQREGASHYTSLYRVPLKQD